MPYVLITPARNEEHCLPETIRSVVAQSVLPDRWVIVDDGSTDGTAAVASRAAQQHSFIRVVTQPASAERTFAHKARAFARGVDALGSCWYDYIGNLDADISLPTHYYQTVLEAFEKDPSLGIAGGAIHEPLPSGEYFTADKTLDSVAGAVQLMSRQCFIDVGGYPMLPLGGIDAAVEIEARRKGWTVRKLPDLVVKEQRRTGWSHSGSLRFAFAAGQRMQSLGYHPLFYALRAAYRLGDPPRVMGSVAGLLGFLSRAMSGQPPVLPVDTVRFLRDEQRAKLKALVLLRRRRPVSDHVG